MPIKRFYRLQRARLTAAPLSLQPVIGWRGRLLRIFFLLCISASLLGLGGYLGFQYALNRNALSAAEKVQRLASQSEQLGAVQAKQQLLEQQIKVGQGERNGLLQALTAAQGELAGKQETLAFFESLLQSNDRSRAVSFSACELQSVGAGRWRYRLLLVQGMDRSTEFAGRLQASVQFQEHGKRQSQQIEPLTVKFSHYLRQEGELTLPVGAVPQVFEARVFTDSNKQAIASCQKKGG
ncbi:DUF6776 family protein [Iodobacter fluviatilis]|uniref:Uncharacterized protein n=1 Tax=Iodobacter fluviatilis TaxID=537 RepID=A0A7G3GBZ8_9NEIS|nr:DUF6776 family protein [Iodobacter fluviatilis]QBC44185.1 hypothetical protein C1H71_12005 [Iodobacter fluviatilis]